MSDPAQLLNHAEWLLDQRWLHEAICAFRTAEQNGADPDRCSAGRWSASMLLGRFSAAWRESDAIRRRGAPDPHRFWNGESIDGKTVIVRCLHGLGDAIQFLRYIPFLRKRAARVIVETAPQFVELAEMIDGIDHVITWSNRAPARPPHWDVQIEVTELPYFFRTELKDLPLATNYIHLPQPTLRSAARCFPASDRIRVGIAWSCGEWNLSRSIPIDLFEPILHDSRFEFWNLQGGAVRKAWTAFERFQNVHDSPEFCADAGLLPLACFMAQLDLVITVDTLAAHLGGALSLPTWVLLRHDSDWRWMVDRSDSPWYPSLRLFRQDRSSTWNSVVSAIKYELAYWNSARSAEEKVA